jgi:hypothetical protein
MGLLSCFARAPRSAADDYDRSSDMLSVSATAESISVAPSATTASVPQPCAFVPHSVAELHPEYAHAEPYHFTARTDSARLVLEQASGAAALLRGPDATVSAREMRDDMPTSGHLNGARNNNNSTNSNRKVELIEEDIQANMNLSYSALEAREMAQESSLPAASTSPSTASKSSKKQHHNPAAKKKIAAEPMTSSGANIGHKKKKGYKKSPAQSPREPNIKSADSRDSSFTVPGSDIRESPDENNSSTLNNIYAALETEKKILGRAEMDDGQSSVQRRSKIVSPHKSMSQANDQSRESMVERFMDDPEDMRRSSFTSEEDVEPPHPRLPRLPTSALPPKSALSSSVSKSMPRPTTPSTSLETSAHKPPYRKTVSFREEKPTIIEPNLRSRSPAVVPGSPLSREDIMASKKRQSLAVRNALTQQIRGVPRSAMLAYAENEVEAEGTDVEEGSQVGPYSDDWFDDMSGSYSSMVIRDKGNPRDSFAAAGQSVRSRARSTRSIRMPPEIRPGMAPPPPPPPPFEPARSNIKSIREVPPPPPDARASFMKLKAQGAPEASSIDLPPLRA